MVVTKHIVDFYRGEMILFDGCILFGLKSPTSFCWKEICMFPGFGRERRRRTVWNLFVFVFFPKDFVV